MLQYLIATKLPTSKPSVSIVYNTLDCQKIGNFKTFDDFAKKLRIMYKTYTQVGIPYDEGYLMRCFIQGLDHLIIPMIIKGNYSTMVSFPGTTYHSMKSLS